MQIACHNPFSLLSSKKVRQETKERSKDTKPAQRKEAPKKNADAKKAENKKEEPPKKDAKVVSLTEATKQEDLQKQIAKEQEKHDKEAKREKAATDKHDRSGKGHQVRKEGKGVGGWDDNKVDVEIPQEVVVEEVEGEEKKEKKVEKDEGKSPEELAAEAKAREEEAKLREMEEKQMTLEEWQEKRKEKAPPTAAFSIRTVDDSGFKGMVAKGKDKGEVKFQIGAEKVKKPAAPKKEEKKKEEKEKVQVDVGFRMENPARQGKGKGEGRGRGRGGGRGGYQNKEEHNAPQVDDEKAFPALGATKVAEETEA